MSVVLQLPPPPSLTILVIQYNTPPSPSLSLSVVQPSFSPYTGLQTQEMLRGHTDSPGQHCTGLLEDGQES